MGEMERRALERPLEQLLDAFAQGDAALLGESLVDEPYLYLSTHGNAYVKADLCAWFADFYREGLSIRWELGNNAILAAAEGAYQYANLVATLAQDERSLRLVGTFVNELALTEGRWLIRTLRFELQGDDAVGGTSLDEQGIIHYDEGSGDRSLIAGWKLANDRVGLFMDPVPEQGVHVIVAEFDAPWLQIGQPCEQAPDLRARCKNLFCRFCFAYDFMSFKLLSDVLAPDATFALDDYELNAQDGLLYLKQRRQGSPLSFSAGQLTGFEELGDGRCAARFEGVGIWNELRDWCLTFCEVDGQLRIERVSEEVRHV